MREILSVLFALAAVLALVVVTIWGAKMLMKKFGIQGTAAVGAGGIEIIACRGISPDKSLMAVRVGEKRLLLGITAADIRVLAELSEKDAELLKIEAAQPVQESFGEILAKNFKEKFGAGTDSGNKEKDGKL